MNLGDVLLPWDESVVNFVSLRRVGRMFSVKICEIHQRNRGGRSSRRGRVSFTPLWAAKVFPDCSSRRASDTNYEGSAKVDQVQAAIFSDFFKQ